MSTPSINFAIASLSNELQNMNKKKKRKKIQNKKYNKNKNEEGGGEGMLKNESLRVISLLS